MPKRRIGKARRLIKKFQDSWGSLEHHFKQRQIQKQKVKEALKELDS